jgi:hypothetical protein
MAGGKQSTVSARHPRSLCVLGSHISIVVEYIAIRDGLEKQGGRNSKNEETSWGRKPLRD